MWHSVYILYLSTKAPEIHSALASEWKRGDYKPICIKHTAKLQSGEFCKWLI